MAEWEEGGCLCGAVRYAVLGESVWKALCYCESCCRAAGAPVVAWAGFKRDNFQVSRGEIRYYASSANALRGFCVDCGTTLTYEQNPDSDAASTAGAMPDEIFITTVTLDDTSVYPPDEGVFNEEMPGWMRDAHTLTVGNVP